MKNRIETIYHTHDAWDIFVFKKQIHMYEINIIIVLLVKIFCLLLLHDFLSYFFRDFCSFWTKYYIDIVVTLNLCFELVAQTIELPTAKNGFKGWETIPVFKKFAVFEVEIPVCDEEAAPSKLYGTWILFCCWDVEDVVGEEDDDNALVESNLTSSTPPFPLNVQIISCFWDKTEFTRDPCAILFNFVVELFLLEVEIFAEASAGGSWGGSGTTKFGLS